MFISDCFQERRIYAENNVMKERVSICQKKLAPQVLLSPKLYGFVKEASGIKVVAL